MKTPVTVVLVLIFSLLSSQAGFSQGSLVAPGELKQALLDASTKRTNDLKTVQTFLGSDEAQKALRSEGMDPERLQKAVATLSPDELASLASRTRAIQQDFAAGSLTNQQLTYIVIALGTAILVLILVH